MLFNIFFILEGSFLLGAVLLLQVLPKLDLLKKRAILKKYIAYFMIVHLVVLTALFGNFYFLLLMMVIILLGSVELICAFNKKTFSLSFVMVFLIYLLFAGGLILFSKQSNSKTIIFVYLTVANMDAFSQIVGQWIGKRKITPKLSPNKTLEGFLGGATSAILTTILLRSLIHIDIYRAIAFGLLLSVASLIGDLMASYCKRINHIKDFGTLLPGHGGILDRFDSLLVAAPVYWLLMGYY